MRYLFLTNTPAHVHLYKHPVRELRASGHEVLVLGRRYGCTEALLDYYDLPYRIYGECDTTKYSLFRELPGQYLSIFRQARRFDPDCVFGYGAYAAHAGAICRAPTVLVLDSEPTSLDHTVSRPFADAILTPHAFEKDLGANHYRFQGFKESAYLHPDVFELRTDIRAEMGLEPDDRYVFLRFNAFGSHHDVGESGFSPDQRRELIERLDAHATVFVSDEGGGMDLDTTPAERFDVHPALVHDALAAADLLITDTQTMATEAALLGTPTIRSNSFVGQGDMGNFHELERNGLVHNIRPFDEVLETALDLLTDGTAGERWRRRRDEFVADTVNLTELIVEVARTRGEIGQIDALTADRAHVTA
jgi:predicted glycosyltransferase